VLPRHKALVLCCVTLAFFQFCMVGEESIDSTFQEKKPFLTTPVSCPWLAPRLGLWLLVIFYM